MLYRCRLALAAVPIVVTAQYSCPFSSTMAEAGEEPQECKALIFEFYDNYQENAMSKKVAGNCKGCKKIIKGQAGVTSNFVKHLNRR